jgi:hypothetical protein
MLNVSARAVRSAVTGDQAEPDLVNAVEQSQIAFSLAALAEAIRFRAVSEPDRAHFRAGQALRAEQGGRAGGKSSWRCPTSGTAGSWLTRPGKSSLVA